jgi:hypothetical protein
VGFPGGDLAGPLPLVHQLLDAAIRIHQTLAGITHDEEPRCGMNDDSYDYTFQMTRRSRFRAAERSQKPARFRNTDGHRLV